MGSSKAMRSSRWTPNFMAGKNITAAHQRSFPGGRAAVATPLRKGHRREGRRSFLAAGTPVSVGSRDGGLLAGRRPLMHAHPLLVHHGLHHQRHNVHPLRPWVLFMSVSFGSEPRFDLMSKSRFLVRASVSIVVTRVALQATREGFASKNLWQTGGALPTSNPSLRPRQG